MKKHTSRFLDIVDDSRSRIRECTVDDVQARMEDGDSFRLVDVREESEWNRGHLPGAVHLGKGVIERDIEKTFPETDCDLVLYCGGGYRSALAADALQKMGYTNVSSMDGGYTGWMQSGFPIEDEAE